MSNYDAQAHKDLKTKFLSKTKLVLKEKISTNPVKLQEYKEKIACTYNEYIEYIGFYFDFFDSDDKPKVEQEVVNLREKLKKCYDKLNITVDLPTNLTDLIELSELGIDLNLTGGNESDVESKQESGDELNDDSNDNLVTTAQATSETNTVVSSVDDFESFSENSLNKMALDEDKFAENCAKQIYYIYTGDPLQRDAFINSIKFLKQRGAAFDAVLKSFILTKLGGKALECIPENVADVDAIIAALKANIKPESSKVVEGKMMALKMDNNGKATEFMAEAEKLAEALQRSLVIEGISLAKAKSMTVDKTVEMCRQTAKSTLVKSVLASTTFTSPEEVVAKFVVESATDAKEKQIFKFSQQRNNNNNNRGNNNRRYNNNNNRQNRNNNGNNNWRNNGNNNNQNNGRGNRNRRGRGRNNYQNNQNDRFTIRVANSENLAIPSGDRRAQAQEGQVISFQRVNDN